MKDGLLLILSVKLNVVNNTGIVLILSLEITQSSTGTNQINRNYLGPLFLYFSNIENEPL